MHVLSEECAQISTVLHSTTLRSSHCSIYCVANDTSLVRICDNSSNNKRSDTVSVTHTVSEFPVSLFMILYLVFTHYARINVATLADRGFGDSVHDHDEKGEIES